VIFKIARHPVRPSECGDEPRPRESFALAPR
jgi:hypothetical protein